MPYFAGFLTGETDALIQSFAGEPEVHYPVRGRVKGERAFAAYAAATKAWLEERDASIEDIGLLRTERRSVGEAVLHLDGRGRARRSSGRDRRRPPVGRTDRRGADLLQQLAAGRPPREPPAPAAARPGAARAGRRGDYQRALAAGDVDAIVATFEPDG